MLPTPSSKDGGDTAPAISSSVSGLNIRHLKIWYRSSHRLRNHRSTWPRRTRGDYPAVLVGWWLFQREDHGRWVRAVVEQRQDAAGRGRQLWDRRCLVRGVRLLDRETQ